MVLDRGVLAFLHTCAGYVIILSAGYVIILSYVT